MKIKIHITFNDGRAREITTYLQTLQFIGDAFCWTDDDGNRIELLSDIKELIIKPVEDLKHNLPDI